MPPMVALMMARFSWFLPGLSTVQLFGAFALLLRRKWGLYLYIVGFLVGSLIALSLGSPITSALLGLVGVGITWALVQQHSEAYWK